MYNNFGAKAKHHPLFQKPNLMLSCPLPVRYQESYHILTIKTKESIKLVINVSYSLSVKLKTNINTYRIGLLYRVIKPILT